jgi:CIC family chloride channel protein
LNEITEGEEKDPGKRSPKPWTLFGGFTKRFTTSNYAFTITIAILIGIAGGYGAVGFRLLIRFFGHLFYGVDINALSLLQATHWYQRLVFPAVGGLIIAPIVYRLAREAKGHGVPVIIESVALKDGLMRPRVTFAGIMASSITIGSGGSAGREGPIALIGAAAGSTIGQVFKVSGRNLKTFVGCGAAAGIAATFNAPIAGALFAVEILLGDFRYTNFSPIVVSSVTATVISRYYLGDFPAFIVPAYELRSAWEFIPYLILGVTAGLVSYAFVKLLNYSEGFFERETIPSYLKPVLGGIAVGLIGIFFPHVFGSGYDPVGLALTAKLSIAMLVGLMFAKIVATSLTLGSGGSGGIFAPSLFIGAMMGGAIGSAVQNIFPQITSTPGAYALVGMGALVASATQAPITAIIIIFEMTGDYKIVLPLMVSCIIGTLFYSSLSRESIYTIELVKRGIRIERGREVNVLKSIPVKNVMISQIQTIPEDMKYNDILRLTAETNYSYFPVVDAGGEMTSILSMHDLRKYLMAEEKEISELTAKDLATRDIIVTYPGEDLDEVFKKFGSKNIEEIPVVDPEHSRIPIGMVRRREAIEAYNNEIIKRGQID